MLGDAGAQGHVGLSSKMMNKHIDLGKVKMSNRSTANMRQIDDAINED